MPDWKRRMLGLGLPCLAAFLLDTSLRLLAQPPAYWAGNYELMLLEGSPFVRMLYAWHPLAAVAAYAMWAAIVAVLLVLLPQVLAVVLTITITFGHVAGAFSWSAGLFDRVWYLSVNGMFLASGIGLGVGLHWYLTSAARAEAANAATHRLPPMFRWALIVALSGMGCGLFIIWR